MFTNVYIISLDQSRLETTTQRLRNTGYDGPITHINGVRFKPEHRSLVPSLICRYLCTNSQLGIHTAHVNALQTAVSYLNNNDKQSARVLILEDDVAFAPNFLQSAHTLLQQHTRTDIILLGNMISNVVKPTIMDRLMHVCANGTFYYPPEGVYQPQHIQGLHAYAVNRPGAVRLYDYLKDHYNFHIDATMQSIIRTGYVSALCIKPSLVTQSNFNLSSQAQCIGVMLDTPIVDRPPIGWCIGQVVFRCFHDNLVVRFYHVTLLTIIVSIIAVIIRWRQRQ